MRKKRARCAILLFTIILSMLLTISVYANSSSETSIQDNVDVSDIEIEQIDEKESEMQKSASKIPVIYSEEKKEMSIEIIIPVAVIIVAALAVSFNKIRKTKNEEPKVTESRHHSERDDDETTMLMKSDEEEENTVLMRYEEGDEDETCMVKTIVLRAENGIEKFEFKCAADVTIGRKSVCNVQITGDKSVSGVHCIISCDGNGNPVIRDNNSSNGTYLNDEKLVGEKYLEAGDSLEIGRTRYSVQIIGE